MRIGEYCFYLDAAKNFFKVKLFAKKKTKIRVGFIVRELAVINKSLSIINHLINDSRFEVYLLCVPTNIHRTSCNDNNDTYECCSKLGYSNLVNTLNPDGDWLSIESMNLDYIFYNTPYNHFYPKQYKSSNVSKYCKICVCLYAMTMMKDEITTTLNKDFFKYVYYFFSEAKSTAKYNKDRYLITHWLGLQKSEYLGIPVLEYFYKYNGQKKSTSWSFSKNEFRVIWTPRWTTDKRYGGSNFFEYSEKIIKFFEVNTDLDLLLRPHPIMFENFLKTGELSQQDYDGFIHRIKQTKNIDIDTQKDYLDTFYDSNILISDISSVIPEYLITGNPVIFCKQNMILELTDECDKFIKACYCVETDVELINCIEKLSKGLDPMKEIRMQIIKECFGDVLCTATENIVSAIVKDYGK